MATLTSCSAQASRHSRCVLSPATQTFPKEQRHLEVSTPRSVSSRAQFCDLAHLWTVLPRQLSGSQMGQGLPPVATPAQARALRLGDTSVPPRPAPPAAGPARPGFYRPRRLHSLSPRCCPTLAMRPGALWPLLWGTLVWAVGSVGAVIGSGDSAPGEWGWAEGAGERATHVACGMRQGVFWGAPWLGGRLRGSTPPALKEG